MVHTFSLKGCKFAVDGNSGNIHALDDISLRILEGAKESLPPLEDILHRLGDMYPAEDIAEAYGEIEELKEEGLLFASEEAIKEAARAQRGEVSLKALCLHVSHDCNLACDYCFASKGDYESGRKLMPRDVALKAIDYLVENSGHKKNIEIDFFGGEPLLNFDTVKAAVMYGKELEEKLGKKFHFTVTTNGTLLDDEKIAFINRYMDNVVISIDGRREVHDAIRRDRAGRATYDRILPLAKKLVEEREGKSYFIRGTFTSRNKDFSKDLDHLAGLGFEEISLEPVVGKGQEFYIGWEDVPAVLDEYERLAGEYLEYLRQGKKLSFYHFNLNLYEGPCIYKRITACGAGFEYFAVSPEGCLYPCHQFVGREEFIMGDVFNGLKNEALRDVFKASNILTKQRCRDCWAKLFCSGGCNANAWFSNGSISQPDEIACVLQKKRIECAIMVQAALEENGAAESRAGERSEKPEAC